MITAPILWAAFVVVMLLVVGLIGPVFLRKAAPALARVPRVAIALLAGGILIWPAALLSLGLIFAWVVSGPVILPVGASEVCRQCLAASNPFTTAPFDTRIPSAVLIAVPVLVGAISAVGVIAEYRGRVRRSRHTASVVLDGSTRQMIHGHTVAVVADDRPWALTFSSRQGGIAVSTGTLDRLGGDELAAVLAHEAAHLRQRHHVVSDLVASIAAHLRWVPFIREAAAALPAYLEIAADERACRQAGTPAMVRALLVLGDRTTPAGVADPASGPLLAAGPDRIPHLVRPEVGRRGYFPAAAASAQLLILGAVSAVVLASYTGALLSGCI
ncbi:M56 family metallopeptidase [Corynebacterium sp. L4756]|uniref:M56 family metallopeptidase n=1 Tax=Corynebacterium TaxID=1716 RepID=UPI001459237F|nr:M56 family metallopeptidase [Corynebacterium ammoniagenes]NMF33112.1 M56 family metallopeptidase [Corynebacterium ammoniagenes]